MPSINPDSPEARRYSLSILDNPTAICRCVKKHVPKPMELHRHHIWPLGEGGPDTKENLLLLCPTTHSNVHMLWRLYEKYRGTPPWDILNNYSEYCRMIVEKGRELARQGASVDRNLNPSQVHPGQINTTNGI